MNTTTPTPVQLTKLITNQLILGKTTVSNNTITIQNPYEAIPTAEGVQIIPYDQHITGVKITNITLSSSNTVYSNEVSQELSNLYLTQISGIIAEPKKELIL